MEPIILRYEADSNVDAAQLAAALDEMWEQFRDDSVLRDRVSKLGADPDQVFSTPRRDIIGVEQEGAGFGATALLVFLMPALNQVARDLWSRIILPQLELRWGRGALKPSDVSRD
jgi:hypothetical protein